MRKLARPHFVRAVISIALALGGLIVASEGQLRDYVADRATDTDKLLAIVGTAMLLLFGIASVRMFAHGVRAATGEHLGDSRSGPLGVVISVVGYVIVVLSALSVLDVDMSGLLLGGALTGVIIGIAAQQTLGNFFAGLVLLLVRPFTLGETVVLKSGPLGGEYEGLVTDMGLFYVRLQTARGAVQLPNAGVLASAVGPGARSEDHDDEVMEDDPGPEHGGTP
ncbi:MAG: small conductance mechanosensitive channel [Actinomycetota bacterium]|nr:small conductance mechanosensitive channel [Actinomycetota bacterium]